MLEGQSGGLTLLRLLYLCKTTFKFTVDSLVVDLWYVLWFAHHIDRTF